MTSPCITRVLLVENDPLARGQLLEILGATGFNVRTADGQGRALMDEARRQAVNFKPHVVIMDLRLLDEDLGSDRSGLELLKDECFSSSRCILHSAYLRYDYRVTRDALVDARVADVVGKEESPRRLITAVETAAREGCICRRKFSIEWPPGWDKEKVLQTLFEEATDIPADIVIDIIGHIFPDASLVTLNTLKGIEQSSASVFRGRTVLFQAATDNKEPFVIKLAPRSRTEKEIKAYKDNIEDRLGGRYYAQLHDYKIFWELGGICYRFIGSDQETIKPFTAFYQEQADSIKIIKPIKHFFEQVWRSHFLDPQVPLTGNLFSAYDAFLKLSQRLGDPADYQPVINLEGLSGRLLHPLRWILDHKEESVIPTAAQAITHGDLHGDNLFVDEEHAWAIDFERSRLGPVLRDFVELEVDIVTRLVTPPMGGLQAFKDLAILLCGPGMPEASILPVDNQDPEILKCLEVIQALRSMAHRMTGYQDMREYYWGLLFDTIFSIISSEEQTEKWERGLVYASLLCERLMHWSAGWPTAELSVDNVGS